MNTSMILTFVILVITTILFMNGKIRSDLVAISSLLALALFGIISPTEAVAGFSNSVVVMIAALFIVGAGIFNTGLADKIGNSLLRLGNDNQGRSLLIIMVTVAILSAFMSNTGTVAVLLPVVISIALRMNVSPGQFLIPLAFASSAGGVLTLIGTPPNLVVDDVLRENEIAQLSFFSYLPVGLIVLAVCLVYMLTIGRTLLPQSDKSLDKNSSALSPREIAGLYKIYDKLHFIRIPDSSELIGKSLQQLQLSENYSLTVVIVNRKSEAPSLFSSDNTDQIKPRAAMIIEAGDDLLLFGDDENFKKFSYKYNVEFLEDQSDRKLESKFLSSGFGLTEAVIVPQSGFVNKSIHELKFRKKYGCSVLALNRKGSYIQENPAKTKLRSGDAILIHGDWENIELLAEKQSDIVVLGRVAEEASSSLAKDKAPIAAGIMIFMLVLMTLELIDPLITVLLSAFLMVVTRCLRSISDAYKQINWESVVLIAAMLPMATALEKTGGVEFLSNSLISLLGDYGMTALLGGFLFLTMVLSQFISNTATAVIIAPVALSTALQLGVSPLPFLIGVAVAASMAFSTPVASPTNALVMSAGGYKFKDFVKIGVPLQVIVFFVLIFVLPIIYPF